MRAGIRSPHRRALALVATTVVLSACDDRRDVAVTGPSTGEGIVLERAELEQQFVPERCVLKARIRNATAEGHRVTLVFRALDGAGAEIGFAQPTVDFVAAGARAHAEARLRDFSDDGFLNDCDRVARMELAQIIL
jgi:hypothetical protein